MGFRGGVLVRETAKIEIRKGHAQAIHCIPIIRVNPNIATEVLPEWSGGFPFDLFNGPWFPPGIEVRGSTPGSIVNFM